jgi:hypothetical protein
VQALPSLQGAVLLACTHPDAGLQLSSVHGFVSAQFGGGPPTHVPPEQVSFVVQALLSSHGAVLLVYTHPVAGLQLSSVHGFVSAQFGGGPPTQVPPEQVSFVVQALLSLHAAVLLVCTHPVARLQLSSVHGFVSSQFGGGPPTQVPPEQVSFVVQAFLSSQAAWLLVYTQPVAGLQLSSVQTFPSLQTMAVPHVPLKQLFPCVQALLSSQAVELRTPAQEATGSKCRSSNR